VSALTDAMQNALENFPSSAHAHIEAYVRERKCVPTWVLDKDGRVLYLHVWYFPTGAVQGLSFASVQITPALLAHADEVGLEHTLRKLRQSI
jgi:hypothetical protein